jgi:hypothetical protein
MFSNDLLNGDPNLCWPSGLLSGGKEDEVLRMNYDNRVDEIETENMAVIAW